PLGLRRRRTHVLGYPRALVRQAEELHGLVVEPGGDPAAHAVPMRLRAAGLDEHLANPSGERQVGPTFGVNVTQLPLPEAELDAAEAVWVHRDALPRADLAFDSRADILHACRSTSV